MVIKLRKAHLSDFDALYRLRTDEVNIAWSGHVQKPEKNSFLGWYINQLRNETRTIYLAVDEGKNIFGYCYLDIVAANCYDISYGVYAPCAGCGVGTQMIRQIIEIVKNAGGKEIEAWISIKNYASRRIVEKNGFVETKESKMCRLPLLPNCGKFTKWIKNI